jgi:hypothetical protein
MSKHRNKLLIGVLVLVLLVVLGDQFNLKAIVTGPLDSRTAAKAKLEQELQKREKAWTQARRDARDVDEWRKQALPSDPQVARSLYQAWLLDLVGRVGFTHHAVETGEPRSRGGKVYPILFQVQGRGDLKQLTEFLHEFYRAGHLHQIQSLVLTPVGRRDTLDIAIAIEALALPDADRKDQLSSETSKRLAQAGLDDYRVIAERNLFGTTGPSDPTDHAFLTAVNYINGEPEAWFSLRTEAEPDRAILKVRPGSTIHIGQFTGTVVEIDDQDVVLDAEGERWLVTIGENLAQATALPPVY